jgi:hypothetical protein
MSIYTRQARYVLKHTSILFHQLLLLLLYVAEVSSSLNHHEKQTIPESNFITLQGILTHTLGNFPFRATIPFIFRVVDQHHHKRLQDYTHIQYAGCTSTA